MNNPKMLALITIILWSFGMYLGRLIAIKSQFVLLALSFFFSFITILFYKTLVLKDFSRSAFKSFKWMFLWIGPLGYFVYSVSLNQSSRQFNGISETTILNYTWPIFTILFTHMLAHKEGRNFWYRLVEALGVFFGFWAVVNMAVKGNYSGLDVNIPGILWGLIGGMSYGLYSAYSGTLKSDEQSLFLVISTFSSLILVSLCALSELNILNTITLADVGVVCISGFLLNGVGYITWTSANRLAREKQINISSVASLMFVLPVISLLISSVLLNEKLLLQPYFLISLGLIVVSSFLCQKTDWFSEKIRGFLTH
ncbi:MAG: DMT family transporter [Anaerolineae bacterium]|nr:DMT family transporter [Anaerolineae bacterium]